MSNSISKDQGSLSRRRLTSLLPWLASSPVRSLNRRRLTRLLPWLPQSFSPSIGQIPQSLLELVCVSVLWLVCVFGAVCCSREPVRARCPWLLLCELLVQLLPRSCSRNLLWQASRTFARVSCPSLLARLALASFSHFRTSLLPFSSRTPTCTCRS